jgi:hypothetical protein
MVHVVCHRRVRGDNNKPVSVRERQMIDVSEKPFDVITDKGNKRVMVEKLCSFAEKGTLEKQNGYRFDGMVNFTYSGIGLVGFWAKKYKTGFLKYELKYAMVFRTEEDVKVFYSRHWT